MTADSPFGATFLNPPALDFGACPTVPNNAPHRSAKTRTGVRVARAVVEVSSGFADSFGSAAASGLVTVAALLQFFGPWGSSAVPRQARATQAHAHADEANLPSDRQDEWTVQRLEDLAATDPAYFLEVIASNRLQPTVLTYAAEHAGQLEDTKAVVCTLAGLLQHPKSYVREGALIGLARAGTPDAWTLVRDTATNDKSANIREIAEELLSYVEA